MTQPVAPITIDGNALNTGKWPDTCGLLIAIESDSLFGWRVAVNGCEDIIWLTVIDADGQDRGGACIDLWHVACPADSDRKGKVHIQIDAPNQGEPVVHAYFKGLNAGEIVLEESDGKPIPWEAP